MYIFLILFIIYRRKIFKIIKYKEAVIVVVNNYCLAAFKKFIKIKNMTVIIMDSFL
jgi:hypothetical protein